MPFIPYAERMHHPQAKLIPQHLWDDYFVNWLSDDLIPLMQVTTEESLYSQLHNDSCSTIERIQTWVAIVISHPQWNFEQIECLNYQLHMSDALVFQCAAAWGNEPYFQHVASRHIELGSLHAVISDDDYKAFRLAAKHGHLPILKYLANKVFYTTLQAMIAAKDYAAFRGAANHNHLDVLLYLTEKVFYKDRQAMIAACDYEAFGGAAANGHLDVVKYLTEQVPYETLPAMITACDYEAFECAAANGHLDLVTYLAERVSYEILQTMILADHCGAFRKAAENGHFNVVTHLLSYSSLFAYAETQSEEKGYTKYIDSFINHKLSGLRAQKSHFEHINPHGVFNIENDEEARLLFYIIRNFIRQNNSTLQNDIGLLLGIPKVQRLIHLPVTQNEPNELLRLALSVGNREATDALFDIPSVRELAEQNNYYQTIRNRLNLRALARDKESSMTALSSEEQQRLKAVMDRYQPKLRDFGGARNVIEELWHRLKERFESNPPNIDIMLIEGQKKRGKITLPLTWNAFQSIGLLGESYQQSLHAYYQDKNHTAWRFLSESNPWMHPEASYVEISSSNSSFRCAAFNEYISLIGVLYLAAQDVEMQATDGQTIESRFEHFISELAHIGRAHNWNSSSGHDVERDDLEGDRPSCFSGIKRRLFQSVLWHPLLNILTKDTLKQELKSFVIKHFQSSIHDGNKPLIKIAWDKILGGDSVSREDWDALKQLDIPPQKQQAFLDALSKKYGSQFIDDLKFRRIIKDAFLFKQIPDAHIINFGYALPETFFNPKTQVISSNQPGFFAKASGQIEQLGNPAFCIGKP